MAIKLLLVAFNTTREIDGEDRRVRFAANKVADLTDDELNLLDRLTTATGKLHYRDPIQEGGQRVTASEPEVVDVPDYAGQDVAMSEKNVEQLKAYLTFHGVDFEAKATKADLLAAAKTHEAGGDANDPDAGL